MVGSTNEIRKHLEALGPRRFFEAVSQTCRDRVEPLRGRNEKLADDWEALAMATDPGNVPGIEGAWPDDGVWERAREIVRESREAEARTFHLGHRVSELRTFFEEKLAPAGDWKGPICTWIHRADLAVAKVACEYFTATELWVGRGRHPDDPNRARIIQVYAPGYRNGPAGP